MPVTLQPLATLSPSQYGRLLGCPYQVLLERSAEGKAVLGTGRGGGGAGAVGTIVHGVLEKANRTGIRNEAEFETAWQHQLAAQEARLMKEGLQHLVPLAYRARGYAVTKLLLSWLLLGRQVVVEVPEQGLPLGPEQRLSDSTGRISGIADLIRRGMAGGLEILDYKTGQIFKQQVAEGMPVEIKSEYIMQLQLYAALLHEHTGQWPERLLIADLAGGEYPVAFTASQCATLLAAAQQLHRQLNEAIVLDEAATFAVPAAARCASCQVQALCEPHAAWIVSQNAA